MWIFFSNSLSGIRVNFILVEGGISTPNIHATAPRPYPRMNAFALMGLLRRTSALWKWLAMLAVIAPTSALPGLHAYKLPSAVRARAHAMHLQVLTQHESAPPLQELFGEQTTGRNDLFRFGRG